MAQQEFNNNKCHASDFSNTQKWGNNINCLTTKGHSYGIKHKRECSLLTFGSSILPLAVPKNSSGKLFFFDLETNKKKKEKKEFNLWPKTSCYQKTVGRTPLFSFLFLLLEAQSTKLAESRSSNNL